MGLVGWINGLDQWVGPKWVGFNYDWSVFLNKRCYSFTPADQESVN